MFDQLVAVIAQLGNMLRPWAFDIATAMLVCLILVLAADMNRIIRRHLSGHSFVLRTLVFIIVNAFGYGLLIVKVTPWAARQVVAMPAHWMFILIVSMFIFIGYWAQRNNQA
jgi:cell division protein FtsW (lipid II flippase)